MTTMATTVDSLTKKMYGNGLFSPEDNENLIDIKLKLDNQMLISPDPALAPLYYKIAILFKSREMKDEAVDSFQTILENFSDTALAPKAAAQLKQSGVIFNDMSNELFKLVELNNKGGFNASYEGDAIYTYSTNLLIGISICIFIITILLMLIFERIISRPLYDEVGYIAQAVDNITQTLSKLTDDTVELIKAAQAGNLSIRADAKQHPGEFGVIVQGINNLLRNRFMIT
jgi:methyl-accepting chemotaxis protein